jgi:hypothetical protein
MRLLGRILSAALILVIVPLFTLSACNLAFERTVRNPDIYKNAFEHQNIYNDLLPVALPAIFQAARNRSGQIAGLPVDYNDLASVLTPDDWRVITAELIPPEWLKAQFEQIVDTILNVLNNDFSGLNAPVNLSELKTRLTGEPAQKAAEYIITTAPECSAEQLTRIGSLLTDSSARLPICNPNGAMLRATSISYIVTWLQAVGNTLPEENVTVEEFYRVTRQDARAVYLLGQLNSQVMIFLYLCPAALCALMVFFTVRSLNGFGRWMGFTGMVTGISILALLVLLNVMLISMMGSLINTSSGIERFLGTILSALVLSIIAGAGSRILIQAGIFIGIGFLLLALSFLVRAPDEGLIPAGSVLISDDGKVISTASRPGIMARPASPDDVPQ